MGKRRPSGDGMVRGREDGRWEGRIVVGHKANGDSIFRYFSAGSQRELMRKLHREQEVYQGVDLTEECRITLAEWLDRWMETYMEGTVRASTLRGMRHDVERHIKPRLGKQSSLRYPKPTCNRCTRRCWKTGGSIRTRNWEPGSPPPPSARSTASSTAL